MPKILIIGSFTRSLINFRGNMIKDLREKGCEVVTVGPENDFETIGKLNSMGAKFILSPMSRTGLNPIADVLYILWIIRLLQKELPDKVFAYTLKPVLYGGIACRWYRSTQFYPMLSGLGFTWGNDTIKQKIISPFVSFLYKLSLKNAATVFFQNPDNRDLFLKLNFVNRPQVALTYGSGVDLNQFTKQPLAEGQPITFLLVARLLREKGIVEFAEACRILKNDKYNFKAVLVGPFFEHPNALTEKIVDSWVNEGLIDYRGRIADIRPCLKECHVFVLPSYYMEGVPRTLLEALATGRAIITTNNAGCKETVNEGINGFLIPKKNVGALVATMKKFIANPELPGQMGFESRKFAEDKFDVKKVNKIILDRMNIH